MKYDLIKFLICPDCKGELTLEVYKETVGRDGTKEVDQGSFNCVCGHSYPVINGIPRFLPKNLEGLLKRRYPEFSRIGPSLGKLSESQISGDEAKKANTIDRFGYEWTEFSSYNAENFLELIHPVTPEFFAKKVGLDVGCGAGRHLEQAVSYGATMIGVDLSWAIEAVSKRMEGHPSASFVQADLFRLPFRKASFDFIYSLGVLHHTPDPPWAFNSLVPLLKPNAAIMVWIYSSTRKKLLYCLKLARTITTRLPNSWIKALSFMAAVVDYGLLVKPYKILSRSHGLQSFLIRLTPSRIRGYAKYDFHVNYTDWFDRLSYPVVHYYSGEQVEEWYRKAGLSDIKVTPTGLHAWRGFGRMKGA